MGTKTVDARERELHVLTGRLADDTTFDARAEWLEDLAQWLFKRQPAARLQLLFDHLEQAPDRAAALALSLGSVYAELDYVRLFTDTGLPSETGFFPEVWERSRKNLLPEPPIEHEAAALLHRIFRRPADCRWFVHLDPSLRDRLFLLLAAPFGPALEPIRRSMCDAVVLLGIRAAETGTADDVRARTSRSLGRSPFLLLPALIRVAVRVGGTDAIAAACRGIAACREVLEDVFASLETTGISLSLVYRLEYLRHLLDRLDTLLPLLAPGAEPRPGVQLFHTLILGGLKDRSLLEVVRTNSRLLARRVTERAGRTGDHYVTRTRTELHAMVASAAGGGALTAVAVAIKVFIGAAHLPMLFDALAMASNYAGAFISMQLCQFTLATKQPSMTAAALAHAIKCTGNRPDPSPLVEQVIRTIRSQLAAFFGNLGMVAPVAIGLDLAWSAGVGHHLLDASHAREVIVNHHPLQTGTMVFAALTGVYLWLGSVAGGMVENWFVVQKLSESIRTNRRLRATIGRARAARLSAWSTDNVAGLGGSIAFAFLLAFVPMLVGMLGVPLEVRHVTFVTGQLTFAGMTLGPLSVLEPDFLWALSGVLAVGILNFSVSFTLALFVAFRAREVGPYNQVGLLLAVLRHSVLHPLDLVRAPPGPERQVVVDESGPRTRRFH